MGLTGGLVLAVSPFLIRWFELVTLNTKSWQIITDYGIISGTFLFGYSYFFFHSVRRLRDPEADTRFQIFNKLPNCVWVFSKEGQRLEMSNEMATAVYGSHPDTQNPDLFRSHFYDFKIVEEILSGKNCVYRNIVMIDKAYEPRYVDLFGIPFKRRREDMILVLVVDHSEVHQSLGQIQKLSDSLMLQNQQLKDFSYMNSHKIRAHVSNILGLISVEETAASGQAMEMLKIAANNLDREVQKMNRLLMEKNVNGKELEQKEQRIVFVDDDKVQHMINKRILLKVNNYLDLFFFENPYQALDWLAANPADVLLLDINMPEMDGWHFLKLMEERGIQLDVKMLTSSLDPDDMEKSRSFGQVSGFLIKPLKDENIAEFLAN
ncbi:Response regulator receiver domain-containing protein [Cyclobacterium lianum]|uniref:Response regulator receiver domain-containing protein n=2 Tax=Cyclobacterium lianum TaxID=388280 RepID=A0A1M7QS16_9BACT|nr:Response regulator receiver domain-containing protein [Cyclobacterium lianum]